MNTHFNKGKHMCKQGCASPLLSNHPEMVQVQFCAWIWFHLGQKWQLLCSQHPNHIDQAVITHISAWEEAPDETVAELRWQAKPQSTSYLPPASLSLHVKALGVLSSSQIENVTSTLKVRSSNWQKRHRNNTSCRDLKSGLSIENTVPHSPPLSGISASAAPLTCWVQRMPCSHVLSRPEICTEDMGRKGQLTPSN